MFYLETFLKSANIFMQLTFFKPRKLGVIDLATSLHIDQHVLCQRFLFLSPSPSPPFSLSPSPTPFINPFTETWPHQVVIPLIAFTVELINREIIYSKMQPKQGFLYVVEPTAAPLHYWVIKMYFIFII